MEQNDNQKKNVKPQKFIIDQAEAQLLMQLIAENCKPATSFFVQKGIMASLKSIEPEGEEIDENAEDTRELEK